MATAKDNKLAVLALTAGGARLAVKISQGIADVQLFLPRRLAGDSLPAQVTYFDNWSETVRVAFQQYRGLIMIMATGIVVRTLAPLLESKQTDPAVVVLDERGKFAISLLSGHLGGANQLAQRLADLLGGTAVITTATDVNQTGAVDLLAQELECQCYPAPQVKVFNRLLAEGERVKLYSQWHLRQPNPKGFELVQNEEIGATLPMVYITNRIIKPRVNQSLLLRPRNLVAGVGCRKGVSPQQVIKAVKTAFKSSGFSLLSLKSLATVDLKMQEPGLLQAARYFKVPLVEVTREQIKALEGTFTPSEFVKQTIGVGGVCEPAAIIASSKGKLRLAKQKLGSITVALAEAKLWWWD